MQFTKAENKKPEMSHPTACVKSYNLYLCRDFNYDISFQHLLFHWRAGSLRKRVHVYSPQRQNRSHRIERAGQINVVKNPQWRAHGERRVHQQIEGLHHRFS